MGKYSKRKTIKINYLKLGPFVMLLIVVILTMGYASISDHLSIGNSKVAIRVDKTIRITGFVRSNIANGGTSGNDEYGYKNVRSLITLPNNNSSVTYNVQVTNVGNAEMAIMAINGLPNNLKYTLTGYNLEATLCDSVNSTQCTLGSVTNFQLTIEYDENGYDGVNTTYNLDLEFDFQEMNYTARIGNHYYLTIQEAIDDSPTDGTETTIVLLKNVYQRIQIWRGNNIVLDMPNLVLHNLLDSPNASGDPVVEIFGNKANENDNSGVTAPTTFKMTNGTIISEVNQGAINVEPGGTFIMTGGSILTSGNRQAVYIKSGGTAEISGTSYLRSTAQIAPNASPPNYRATVHNAGGTLTITGGTIEAVGRNGIALTSESTTTIGTEDGTVSTTVPTFIATDTGIHIKAGTTFNFYDGVAKGENTAIVNESEIDDIETGYDIVHSGDADYSTAHLGHGVTLTFDLDGGTQTEASRVVAPGEALGPLPVPTKTDSTFTGWYDSNDNLIEADSTISANTMITAHWIVSNPYVAQIGNTSYETLALALSNVPANTETTITILKDIALDSIITIHSNENIIFDLNDHILSTDLGTIFTTESGAILKIDDNGTNGTGGLIGGKVVNNKQVTIINNVAGGSVYIRGGTISSTLSQVIDNSGAMYISGGEIKNTVVDQGALNNNEGATLEVTGGKISSAMRQAIYNKGAVTISGTAELTSSSSSRAAVQNDVNGATMTISGGTIISTNTSCQRGAAHNNKGTLTVTGGTIISNSTYNANGVAAIQNAATCIIGVQGGGIDTTTPVIRGAKNAIYNTSTLRIYDGILQCSTTNILGGNRTPTLESNSQAHTGGTVQIDGATYYTWYLEPIP